MLATRTVLDSLTAGIAVPSGASLAMSGPRVRVPAAEAHHPALREAGEALTEAEDAYAEAMTACVQAVAGVQQDRAALERAVDGLPGGEGEAEALAGRVGALRERADTARVVVMAADAVGDRLGAVAGEYRRLLAEAQTAEAPDGPWAGEAVAAAVAAADRALEVWEALAGAAEDVRTALEAVSGPYGPLPARVGGPPVRHHAERLAAMVYGSLAGLREVRAGLEAVGLLPELLAGGGVLRPARAGGGLEGPVQLLGAV